MNYAPLLNALPSGADESKIGIYRWSDERWIYAGGEGRDGKVSAKTDGPGTFAVFYNPEHESAPKEFALAQNYPNPFNPTTKIRYEIPLRSFVTIKIYNLLGQEVKTLVRAVKGVGRYEVEWDGRNNNGQEVASGMYLYRLESNRINRTKKLLLIK
jgi:hypothetical protein